MRLTLSASDSARWASSPAEAFAVEEAILSWAQAEQIEEPVVVTLANGRVAFAFTVGGDDV